MRGTGEGIVILIIGAAAIWGASLVPPPPEGETWAGVLPMVAAVCLTLAGSLMVWFSLKNSQEKDDSPISLPMLNHPSIKILFLVILALLYHQIILRFGYELSTAVVGPAVLWMFGVRSKAGLALSVILYPAIFHLIFFKLLGVFPPLGNTFDLLEHFRG